MTAKARKIAAWTLGMAIAGAIVGEKANYETTWYGSLLGSPQFIIGGALIGAAIGWAFSRQIPPG
jgi:hypothetical protein